MFVLKLADAVLGLAGLTLTALSFWWTTRKARRILSESLNRQIRPGEETSFKVWMEIPRERLRAGVQELEPNPFDAALAFLNSFWRQR
jgi:hypothetical protein